MTRKQTNNRGAARCQLVRRGFTLIELLIVIIIIAILAGLTLAVVGTTLDSDRIRGGARQMQSALLGGLARATKAQQPRGLRFILDENDLTTVSTMVYVEQLPNWKQGKIRFEEDPSDPTKLRFISEEDPAGGWTQFADPNKRRIPTITRIKLPNATGDLNSGSWYTVSTATTFTNGKLTLISELLAANIPGGLPITMGVSDPLPLRSDKTGNYLLELGVAPLPNEDPLRLPTGTVIDLERSVLPREWYDEQLVLVTAPDPVGFFLHQDSGQIVNPPSKPAGTYNVWRRYAATAQMDILFSPRGSVAGSLAAQGKIHLVLSGIEDTLLNLAPEDPTSTEEHRIMTIFTQTGNVSTHEISLSGNRFDFAETGEVAGR